MGNWTHPVCDDCWPRLEVPREPVRIKDEYRDDEVCALCGKPTRSGIYVRIDPARLKFGVKIEGAE